MKKAFRIGGTVGGYLGTLVLLVAIAGRFYGEPAVFGWVASNVLLLGAAILAFACWCKLESA